MYPAWILSGYQPVMVLKNQSIQSLTKSRSAWLRKTLTVTQFVGAQFFIIATILVSKQVYYSLNKDLGYRKDAIIYFASSYGEKASKRQVLLNKLKSIPEIEQACLGGDPPASGSVSSTTMNFEDGDQKKETTVQVKYGDKDYFNLYGMKLLAGHYLEPADSVGEYVVNNSYAKFLGFLNPQDALGKMIGHSKNLHPIVGVMNDFNSKSTRAAIGPLVYSADKTGYYYFHVLLNPENRNGTEWQDAISKMQSAWKEVYPEEDFNYHFFDQSIANFYTSEQNTSKLLRWASGVAILISCLGLLGLAIYTTNQRTKEIGVRKVLGASISQIVVLLSTDFMMLILLAFLIAVPLAWWAMHSWLENFAYRTTLDWWTFVAGGLMMFLVAGIILCLRTIRAASVNPVKSLRSE
jgi:ABC-type antimicrobial peptide transport system permease subunit